MTATTREAITRARALLVRSKSAFASRDVAEARGILDRVLDGETIDDIDGETIDDIVDEGPPTPDRLARVARAMR